jgi:hypothetical protein
MFSRRTFFSATILLIAGVPRRARGDTGGRDRGLHPDPRPGITAANVLTHEQLASAPHAIDVFDLVREIPQIVDGIRCQCGCADLPGFYSLLSCYESEGMARWCDICQGEGRLASRLHSSGKTLDEIRAAIDARFG